MKLISWNVAARAGRAEAQAAALLERCPDVVALQEVNAASLSKLQGTLFAGGLVHARSAVPTGRTVDKSRAIGVVIASRYELSESQEAVTLSDWPEKALTSTLHTPCGPIDLTTVHIPPGASHGWEKIKVFEQVYSALARPSRTRRILCGDFNAPQAELANGEVICWGKRLGKDGQWRLRRSRRGGSAEAWERGEWSVLVGLREYDLWDTFRRIHGFAMHAFSIQMTNRQTITRRRFDHVFASSGLHAVSCDYLHQLREQGLSDHSPIEAVFKDPS